MPKQFSINYVRCNEAGTVLMDVPNGAQALVLDSGRLVAYKRNPSTKGWDWVRKDFRYSRKRS